ncbi:unnamed protein product [Cylindrotheca closterium]|uniref:Uncharacterized protein n=1 Tax=Cylindrotheca closterium TaxID=2856 RepID=A0AAD2G601_9STRA|nr:unnamed protein product [Cylindrotheca closterium]
MASVSERLKAFESVNGNTKEANGDSHSSNNPTRMARSRRTSPKPKPKPKSTLAGTYSSRRRTRSKDNRIDLSDDEMDIDPKQRSQQQQQQQQQDEENHELHSEATKPSSLAAKDMVDLDLVAQSISTGKLQAESSSSSSSSLPLTKDEQKRKAEQDAKERADAGTTKDATNSGKTGKTDQTHQHSKWAMIRRIWKDPLAEEKKRQEAFMLQQLKETDSTFSEEEYQNYKQTQDMFISTKKEEAESVRTEKERQRSEKDAKMRLPLWEKIVQTTLMVFVSSVEAEKRQQEHIVMTHLRAMDSSVDEDDIRRQKEAQELFIDMKRREVERQRFLEMEEVEKQRREAILAENMRLPDGLQSENASLMIQNSIIEQGAKIQEALRSSLFLAMNAPASGEEGERGEGGEAAAAAAAIPPPIPLHIQKQIQQAILLQQANDNPDIEIDEEALRHSREIQESLIFYAQKNQRSSWLESYMPKRSSIPEEVSFNDDDGASVGSRVSWLSGGFGGGSVSRPSWRTSFSKPAAGKVEASSSSSLSVSSSKVGKNSHGKNGNNWNLRSSMNTNNPKVGRDDWAETNLHLAGHAEESENSDV